LINLQQETNEWVLTASALSIMTVGSILESNPRSSSLRSDSSGLSEGVY
jgi:hypothetical protein